jgi:hypothetical protein
MKKHKVIRKLEKEKGIFYSEVKILTPINSVDKIENSKSLEIVCGFSEFENRTLLFRNKLYKTSSGLYIYWEKRNDNSYDITIYHKYEQLSEVVIYVTQLTK